MTPSKAARQITLPVSGMHCGGCVGRVERALLAVDGVKDARVNLATEKATIVGTADPAAISDALNEAGYPVRQSSDEAAAEAREQETATLRRDVALAAALALPVFVLEMGAHLIPAWHHFIMQTIGMQANWLIQFALTTLLLLGPGRRFFALGLPALVRRAPDMNSLVAVGAGAAYLYSLVATFVPGLLPDGTAHVYFEAAAVIVTLILAGRWMEARAKGRTSLAIARLVGLQPKVARVRREGAFVEVDLADVIPGDVLELRPGVQVPVDGVVEEGTSFVDESMISGEPIPVAKAAGDTLVGGTVNQAGHLVMRAEAVGEETVLSQIIRMVEDAQGAKLPIQSLVDRVTMYFVPAVIALALITFGVWLTFGPDPALSFALVNAVAVLIIACPCAMGLATPTSIMVGTGRAAELGVLFRKGDALQSLANVSVVAFDKTGTLTQGAPMLTDVILQDGVARDDVLAKVAALEARSEHPIARALVAAAEGLSLPEVTGFESVTGMGVKGMIADEAIVLGAARFMVAEGIALPTDEPAAALSEAGKTPIYVALNGRLAATLAVSDPIKDTTPAALTTLKEMGVGIAMITGDAQGTADAIATRLGIDHVVAGVRPDGKVDALKALQDAQGAVAFVGDGINDAPALAQADVGLAIGSGTDVAIEAADVVLMSGDLGGVPRALGLSRIVIRNIRQNLFWAFAYNVALIPVAAGLLYPAFGVLLSPIFAAAAMALSSVFVLGNALRLRRWGAASEAGSSGAAVSGHVAAAE